MFEKLITLSQRIEANRVLDAIKRGFLMCVPLLTLGILSMVVVSIPLDGVQEWFATSVFGGGVYRFFNSIYNITYPLMALYLCITVSFMYATHFHAESPFVSAAAVLASLISVMFSLGFTHTGFADLQCDARGVFVSFLVSILCIKLFFSMYYRLAHHQRLVFSGNMKNRISAIYWMMLPFIACVMIFFWANELLYMFFHVVSLNDAVTTLLSNVSRNMQPSYAAALLVMCGESLLWFFGVHGGSVMEPVMDLIFSPGNTDATVIVSRTFLETFTLIGGCGTALSLYIALLLFERRKQQRAILGPALVPILFNVNEPLVFGIPIIFNPILAIPFFLAPLVSLSIAYAATYIGFMPITTTEISWTTPIFLSGYMATGSWRGVFVQFVILLVDVGLYIPFVKMMGNAEMANAEHAAEKLQAYYMEHEGNIGEKGILSQHNSWAIAGSALVSALKDDIAAEHIQMFYQPQIDQEGKIYGAEALLRWKYGGKILFPPFVIHMAKEADREDQLARAIIHQVCKDTAKIKQMTERNLRISANISCAQLNDDVFVSDIISLAKRYQVADQLCVEVTEELSINEMVHAPDNIRRLNAEGIEVSMDDFSMGTTSIKNLRENNFSHVKLDGSLVADMENNVRSKDIVASIINLGNVMGFRVVAEYVDSEKKLEELRALGCDFFQGYYYSPAVPLDEFVEYANGREK